VASAVNRTAFSIGYVEQAYSQGLTLPFAALRNQAGNYVTPSTSPTPATRAVSRSSTRNSGTSGRTAYPSWRIWGPLRKPGRSADDRSSRHGTSRPVYRAAFSPAGVR
jgi:ABC-type phosphate transport system substrate-binding protein